MLPCSNPFNNSPGQVIEMVETVSENVKRKHKGSSRNVWAWPITFRDRWGVSSQYTQRKKKRLLICNLKITYFRDKRKWGCKNRTLSCTTHFSANPVEKWAEVENSFGIERGHFLRGVLVAQMVKNLPAMQGTRVWSLGQEDPLEKEMATHFQYSCLENSMGRGAWQAAFHGVASSQTWLSN